MAKAKAGTKGASAKAKAKATSLHIGLNSVNPSHYDGWSGDLNACEADADSMQEIAHGLGYKSTVIKTAKATRAAVRGAIKAAAKEMGKGDIFFLSYSGHGGQIPDVNGDERDDLTDETWVLYDGQLVDDELHDLWGKFSAGVRIVVLSDSCHSGTVTKFAFYAGAPGGLRSASLRSNADASGVRYRVMPREVALRTYRKNREMYDALTKDLPAEIPPPQASVRLLSGCQDNQLSLDGTFNGLFTGTLLRVWDDGNFKGNYADFHERIVEFMPPDQTPNHYQVGKHDPAFDAQKPFET